MQIIINNKATEYDISGSGKVILLLHGWGADLNSFNDLVSLLSDNFRIVRLDLPGFGRTEKIDNATLDDYVSFVGDFLKKINEQPDCVLGHSFGGRILLKSMASNSFGQKKNIFIDSAGVKKGSLGASVKKSLFLFGRIFLFVPPLLFWRNGIRKFFYKAIGSEYMDNDKMVDVFRNIISEDLSKFATKISLPTLIIWGEKDFVTPVSDGRYLHSLIKDSTFVLMKDGGHFPFIEFPKETTESIVNFVTK